MELVGLGRKILWAAALAGLSVGTPGLGMASATPVPAESRSRATDLLVQGTTAEADGRRAQAIEFYRASLAAAPSPAAWYHLGRALAESGKRAEAIAAFDSALAMSPRYETARLAREKLQKRHGIGNVDLVALEREAETAHSLTETGRILAAAPEPLPRTEYRPMETRARSGVDFPTPPSVPSSTPGVTPPRRTPDTKSPTARIRDDESRSAVIRSDSRPAVLDNSGRKTGERKRQPVESGQTVERSPSAPVPSPASSETNRDGGGADKTQPAAGGRSPGLLGRLGLGPKIAAAPLPESRDFGGHGVEAVNAAAFGPEATKRKSSVGYGQAAGTAALGTFAFHRDRGDQYRSAERWSDARNEYDYALRQAPGDAETRALLGEMHARMGDDRRAIRNLDQAARDNSSLASVPYRRGNALRALDRKDQAIGAYLDAIRLDPKHKDALNNLGVTYMDTGRYQKAAETFERILSLDSGHANAILNLGILYEEHLNDPKRAEGYYNSYLSLGEVPRKTEVRRWLNLLKQGR